MRKARYDMRKVVCKNSSCLGLSGNIAKPGYWLSFRFYPKGSIQVGRVIGRIAETDTSAENCAGWLAVVCLYGSMRAGGVRWVDPTLVTVAYEKPPAKFLQWLMGDWVRNKADIARFVAMGEHGTLSDNYIAHRDNPDAPYNCCQAYVDQFIL